MVRMTLLCIFSVLTVTSSLEAQQMEWHQVEWSAGHVNVALVRPDQEGSTEHPVIFALPWGSGSSQLVETFISSYWLTEPAQRGYYVVAPEIRGPTLANTADWIIPAIFEWMDSELSYDAARVALVGASNGGRGLFLAAVAQPERFQALLALPGQFSGEASELAVLKGKPIRLLVGQFDEGWVESGQETLDALRSQGVEAEFLIARGQGHVLRLNPSELADWIDGALEP